MPREIEMREGHGLRERKLQQRNLPRRCYMFQRLSRRHRDGRGLRRARVRQVLDDERLLFAARLFQQRLHRGHLWSVQSVDLPARLGRSSAVLLFR